MCAWAITVFLVIAFPYFKALVKHSAWRGGYSADNSPLGQLEVEDIRDNVGDRRCHNN